MTSKLSKEEADALYYSKKRIIFDHGWEKRETSTASYARIEVMCEDGTPMDVRGTANSWKAGQHYSFSLLYKKSIVIRRWDDNKHPCPISKIVLNGPHKHYYHPDFDDAPAYETNDITLNDVNMALIDFLKECNVETKGHKFNCILNI